MPQKPTQNADIAAHQEVIAAHMDATVAALQVLVHCLEENGALAPGQMSDALLTHMEMAKHRTGNEMELALLHGLRMALMD